jgi:N utilization substance protein B
VKIRRKGRELALQALYALETGESPVATTIEYLCKEEQIADEARQFALLLAERAAADLENLDRLIAAQATNWKLGRVAIVDKNILRLAIAEMLYMEDVPVKVSIDEAIELAKKYSTEKSGKFVNGILDPIAKQKVNKL